MLTLADKGFSKPGHILCILQNVATIDEVPLIYVSKPSNGKLDRFQLQTQELTRQPVNVRMPMPPPGFTPAKTLAEVVVSKSKKHAFEDLIEEMNVGSEFGTKRK